MLAYWIALPMLLLLQQRVAGMSMNEVSDPRNFALDPSQFGQESGYTDNDGIRRFECPAGFFRLRRFCYYLSGGTSNWRDAHFHCTARNATLAVLNRNGKDKILRKYLMGEQFKRLERWIGGIYNWKQMSWEWGISGDKVLFQNFGNPVEMSSKNRSWQYHCMVLDPEQQYKWNARGCYELKYFICEVPAGRISQSRWRKNISSDPLAPQNQRLRPPRRGSSRVEIDQQQMRRKKKLKSMRKKNYDSQFWAQGIKLGVRPPKGKWQKLGAGKVHSKSPRHGHKQRGVQRAEPRIEQATPDGKYKAFPGNGNLRIDENLQRLGPDFTREEVLLKV